jgi:Uma2 family endonuclease
MSIAHLKLGPADHGRRLTLDDFESAEFEPGHKYEIIDGRVWVSYEPDPAENRLEQWLLGKLLAYVGANPNVLNYVTNKARVCVPGREEGTWPEPDIAAYSDYPLDLRLDAVRWEDVSPLLVCEVLIGDPEKDLSRNVELYFEVPSIREYWVLDGRDDPNEPTLIQHRRHGKRWVVRSFPYGSAFTTKLLLGFQLVIDPRR